MTSADLERDRREARRLLDVIFADLGDLTAQLRMTHCPTCALAVIMAMARASAYVFVVSGLLAGLSVRAWVVRLSRHA